MSVKEKDYSKGKSLSPLMLTVLALPLTFPHLYTRATKQVAINIGKLLPLFGLADGSDLEVLGSGLLGHPDLDSSKLF